jgi:hypothetical protein
MTPEIKAALKRHSQLFGSYTKTDKLVQVRVWLTLNRGKIEFLTPAQSLKAKRVSRNPRVVCSVGQLSVPGTAEIVRDPDAALRTYRAYRKTHPFLMMLLGRSIRSRIRSSEQVVIRVNPDEPNPFAGLTDPQIDQA